MRFLGFFNGLNLIDQGLQVEVTAGPDQDGLLQLAAL